MRDRLPWAGVNGGGDLRASTHVTAAFHLFFTLIRISWWAPPPMHRVCIALWTSGPLSWPAPVTLSMHPCYVYDMLHENRCEQLSSSNVLVGSRAV
jgi:hypothetical protein